MFGGRRRGVAAVSSFISHHPLHGHAAVVRASAKNVTRHHLRHGNGFATDQRAGSRYCMPYSVLMGAGAIGITVAAFGLLDQRPVECQGKAIPKAKELAQMENTFLKYASIKQGEEWLMTPEDFVHSMLPEQKEVSKKDIDRVKMFFKMADTDDSGALDFVEYVTFFSLISKPEAEFEVAFQLFDINGDGYIERREFEQVIGAATEYGTALKNKTAFISHFFGEEGHSKKLTFKEFKELLQELKNEMLKLEFSYYDKEGKGVISGEDFMKLISHHSEYSHIPSWLQQNLLEMGHARISFEQFAAFNHVVKDIRQIETAIRMYTASGGHVGKDKFKRAVEVTTGHAISPAEVDLIFSIFDRHKKGELDHESFLYLMNNRAKRKLAATAPTMSIPQTFLLGGVSAMVGASCVYPMDKVKTRLQSAKAVPGVQTNMLKEVFHTFANIAKKEGFFGMYKGLAPQMVGIIPEKAIKITVNDFLKRTIRSTKTGDEAAKELTFLEEAVAGIGTGLFQVVATNPYEIVKIRMQLQTAENPGKPGGMLTIIRELGLRGLYTGLPATLLRDVPFNAVYFSSYSAFKKMLKDENGNLSGWSLFCAGIGAGFLGAALDTPADCLKTRLQNGQGKYKGLRDAAVTIWREEGINAFLRGLAPRILIIAPLFAITFMVFEKLQRHFAPQAKPPIQFLAEEFDLVRDSRLRSISSKLDHEFGLHVVRG